MVGLDFGGVQEVKQHFVSRFPPVVIEELEEEQKQREQEELLPTGR